MAASCNLDALSEGNAFFLATLTGKTETKVRRNVLWTRD